MLHYKNITKRYLYSAVHNKFYCYAHTPTTTTTTTTSTTTTNTTDTTTYHDDNITNYHN